MKNKYIYGTRPDFLGSVYLPGLAKKKVLSK